MHPARAQNSSIRSGYEAIQERVDTRIDASHFLFQIEWSLVRSLTGGILA